MLKPLALTLAALGLLAGCDETTPAATAPVPAPAIDAANPTAIANTAWRIATIGGTRVEDEGATRVAFSDTVVSGSFGCGPFSASYAVVGDLLHVGDLGGSAAGCGGALGYQEREGRRRMQMPMQVVQTGARTLILSGREGQNFVLELAQ